MRLPDRLGFRGKTLWDWLQLLIVPAILIAVTFAWSATQTRNDNKREDKRIEADRVAAEEVRQDATLQGYFDEMSGLMLEKKLLISKTRDPVRAVARTVTLTALRRLDGARKGEVVRFLQEAGLLEDDENFLLSPKVLLEGADLRRADLRRADLPLAVLLGAILVDANLRGANLVAADLRGADLTDADLRDANISEGRLGGAKLRGADLRGADLPDADLTEANLRGANLRRADFTGGIFRAADLRDANLEGATLKRADLGGVPLGGANLTDADLAGAKYLDLDRFITELDPTNRNAFLDSQRDFLDSLSREGLAKFNLSPEKLAKLRREASGP